MNYALKIIMILIVVCLLVVSGFFIYVNTSSKKDLTYEDISNLKVEEVKINEEVSIKISGDYLKSSSLVVNEIKHVQTGNDIFVNITTSFPSETQKDSHFELILPKENFSRILFGPEKKQIWP